MFGFAVDALGSAARARPETTTERGQDRDQTESCAICETDHVMKLQRPISSGDGCFAEDRLTASSLIGVSKKSPSNTSKTTIRRCHHVLVPIVVSGNLRRTAASTGSPDSLPEQP